MRKNNTDIQRKKARLLMKKLHKENPHGWVMTHGMSYTRFFEIWLGMKQRCFNPKCKAYKNYGGRGITICKRWMKFKNFYNDMFPDYCEHCYHFGENDTTIERDNNNGNYNFENCSWKTFEEQAKNKRTSWFLKFNGETKTAIQWANELGINYHKIYDRIKSLNWSIEKALTTK